MVQADTLRAAQERLEETLRRHDEAARRLYVAVCSLVVVVLLNLAIVVWHLMTR